MNVLADLMPQALPADPPQDLRESRSCGWFDSSHDLQQGLLVQEHVSLDTLAGAMCLSDWLAWHAMSNLVTPTR
jgi:hypothetical protein